MKRFLVVILVLCSIFSIESNGIAVAVSSMTLSNQDSHSLKSADKLLEEEATMLMLKIDDAINKYDHGEMFAFKTAYESIEQIYIAMPERQRSRIINYSSLEKAYANWRREMEQGILGIFIDILQSDFNPQWTSSPDDLVNRYETGIMIGERIFYTEVVLNSSTYGCVCVFKENEVTGTEWIDYYAIGEAWNDYYSLDAGILQSLDKGSGFLERKDLGHKKTGNLDVGYTCDAYYYEDGKTVCMFELDSSKKQPLIVVFPEKITNSKYIYISYLAANIGILGGHKILGGMHGTEGASAG